MRDTSLKIYKKGSKHFFNSKLLAQLNLHQKSNITIRNEYVQLDSFTYN